ncbi:NADH-quinone oxidoreductase subunit L [Piscirickettsia salmonis]|uniref:NADH-quinone oxidoreductase subunit L n=1 Tax=Piscirickettsia salmonis TaxID=1238 RepID=UPI0012BB1D42|nr:NADH-quinone oxidoreductase subunit L [Piscirickettsia salmonis]QGP52957.1 NADH-quinone oxidoreductase subunit L [Piscirickettsia salmonis]QGP61112.1 NADH-quinone oxidoreductase subunit L [Piscirickettsia salmonis]QGP62529.1 NADH-quinone oxidoreductase subunit L [Piscirickettsia salmonis]
MENIRLLLIVLTLSPLVGAIIAGFVGKRIGRTTVHTLCSAAVAIALILSIYLFVQLANGNIAPFNQSIYTWANIGGLNFSVGFLLDRLSAFMLIVVNFVSLAVHIYTIGYMKEDDGYIRFFSYISAFTFAMITLVLANNFFLLFFGWEAVGLVSYLLIGFWYKKDSAVYANLKAFLINRVGDLGFLLGIAGVLYLFGSLDYATVFKMTPVLAAEAPVIHIWGDTSVSAFNLIGILLFVGAMGKSAQVPLHNWLPDSMEGPTPISALIHAATMVTAGVYMVARLSPLYEHAPMALSLIMILGAITCLFMGLLAIIQNDIKRIVAYCTLSQLGYMVVALGVSAYSLAIFHLMSHAFFKALMFLAAGSAIIAMHHEQDIRKMGGLRKYMPITYWTMLISCVSLIAVPGFSGFFSKDLIIDAVGESHRWGASFAYVAVLGTAFVTALYTFRMFFLCFHTKERMDEQTRSHLKESPNVVTWPLIVLAIPATIAGYFFVQPALNGFFGQAIFTLPQHDIVQKLAEHFPTPMSMVLHAPSTPAFWLALSGVAVAWLFYVWRPELAAMTRKRLGFIHYIMDRKYFVDDIYQAVFGWGGYLVGYLCWRVGDVFVIDDGIVNGTAGRIRRIADVMRKIQSKFLLYHYAFAMIVGLLVLLLWFFLPH